MSATEWRVKGLYSQNPNDVMEEIKSIGEEFTPHDVVEIARNENSVMHDMFEWDDSVAGELYRETQARQIIRMLVIVDDKKPYEAPVRAIVSTGTFDQKYTPIQFTIRNEDAYQDLLSRALAELTAFKRKYATLTELDEILHMIDELI